MSKIDLDVIGNDFNVGKTNKVDNMELVKINEEIRYHDVEICGEELREAMTAMEAIIR